MVVLVALLFGEMGAPSMYIDPTSGWSKEAWKYDVQDRPVAKAVVLVLGDGTCDGRGNRRDDMTSCTLSYIVYIYTYASIGKHVSGTYIHTSNVSSFLAV